MNHELFGSDSAENDSLLYACSTLKWMEFRQPILTGRWGTGKTAALYLANKQLTERLSNVDASLATLWYIDERALDVVQLQILASKYRDNHRLLLRLLENIWFGEIVRTQCSVLHYLWHHYGEPSGPHWTTIHAIARPNTAVRSFWRCIPEVVAAILGADSERSTAIENLQAYISNTISEKALRDLQRCLDDIAELSPQPVIAVEPIETPGSDLEGEGGLAGLLVTALLNVFERHFRPADDQRVSVRISIPWHRWEQVQLDSPQKVFEHVGFIKWSEGELKEFINRRISWELSRVKRRGIHNESNPWLVLFDEEVPNSHCKPEVLEDSYLYLLRHTHHRARDVQRLARLAVEQFRSRVTGSTDDVLSGKHGKVRAVHIRDAVRSIATTLTKEIIEEAERRYPDLQDMLATLIGLSVPCKSSDLKKRLGDTSDIRRALKVLWSAGILGMEIAQDTPGAMEDPRLITASENLRGYKTVEGASTRPAWYLFEYNWDGNVSDSLQKYGDHVKFIFHPKTNEYLRPSTPIDRPLGA